jgi:hypothetical protein
VEGAGRKFDAQKQTFAIVELNGLNGICDAGQIQRTVPMLQQEIVPLQQLQLSRREVPIWEELLK